MKKIPNCSAIKSPATDKLTKKDITCLFISMYLTIFLSYGFTIPNKSCELIKLNEKLGNKDVATTNKETLLEKKEAYFHPLILITRFE